MTRHERRATRQRWFVTAREARLAARLARLDYKVCNESGALRVRSKTRIRNPENPLDRAGTTYVVGIRNIKLTKPIIHHRWRRLTADK